MFRTFKSLVLAAIVFVTAVQLAGCTGGGKIFGFSYSANGRIEPQCSNYRAEAAFINQNVQYAVTYKVTHVMPDGTRVPLDPIYLRPGEMFTATFYCGDHFLFAAYNAAGGFIHDWDVIVPAGCPTQYDDMGRPFHFVLRVNT